MPTFSLPTVFTTQTFNRAIFKTNPFTRQRDDTRFRPFTSRGSLSRTCCSGPLISANHIVKTPANDVDHRFSPPHADGYDADANDLLRCRSRRRPMSNDSVIVIHLQHRADTFQTGSFRLNARYCGRKNCGGSISRAKAVIAKVYRTHLHCWSAPRRIANL